MSHVDSPFKPIFVDEFLYYQAFVLRCVNKQYEFVRTE